MEIPEKLSQLLRSHAVFADGLDNLQIFKLGDFSIQFIHVLRQLLGLGTLLVAGAAKAVQFLIHGVLLPSEAGDRSSGSA